MYLTFIDSDDYIDKNHFSLLMKYAKEFDWVMVCRKDVDADQNIMKIINIKERIKASGKNQVDEICRNLALFVFVTNKLYQASIVKKHDIYFTKNTHIHEDRLFNLNYLRYVNSLIMLPNATYNYLVNPLSLTHNRYADLKMFIYSAEAIDKILESNELGKNMAEYAARYMFNFYFHIIGGCVFYPLKKLNIQDRFEMFGIAFKSLFSSILLKKFLRKTPEWFVEDFKTYFRRLIGK